MGGFVFKKSCKISNKLSHDVKRLSLHEWRVPIFFYFIKMIIFTKESMEFPHKLFQMGIADPEHII